MAMSPVSGTLSPTQLAVLEQIRALRAAKPLIRRDAGISSGAGGAAKPPRLWPLADDRMRATSMAANRPRGLTLNVIALISRPRPGIGRRCARLRASQRGREGAMSQAGM